MAGLLAATRHRVEQKRGTRPGLSRSTELPHCSQLFVMLPVYRLALRLGTSDLQQDSVCCYSFDCRIEGPTGPIQAEPAVSRKLSRADSHPVTDSLSRTAWQQQCVPAGVTHLAGCTPTLP